MSQPPSLVPSILMLGMSRNPKNWSDNAVSQALSRICRILSHQLARIMLAALTFDPAHKSGQEMERLIRKKKNILAAAANNNNDDDNSNHHDMIGHRGLSLA